MVFMHQGHDYSRSSFWHMVSEGASAQPEGWEAGWLLMSSFAEAYGFDGVPKYLISRPLMQLWL
jgi:hypothetical protein